MSLISQPRRPAGPEDIQDLLALGTILLVFASLPRLQGEAVQILMRLLLRQIQGAAASA